MKQCEVCQRTKRKFNRPAPSLHPIPVTDTWNKVGIDLVEFPVSQNGNRYCITLTDYFSKWAEAAAIPTKEAKHVAAFLYKMILRHGCPLEIVSDQGREFCNKLVNSLEERTGFKRKINSAYYPMGLTSALTRRSKPSFRSLSMIIKMTGMISWTIFYLPTGQVVKIQQNARPFFWCMAEKLVSQST